MEPPRRLWFDGAGALSCGPMKTIPILAIASLLCAPLAAQEPPRPAASLPASAADETLLDRVEGLLADAPAGTRYGMFVERMDGTPILAIAPDQRFIPASNTKIYTTLAAYAELPALQSAAEGTGVRIEPVGDGAVDVVLEGRGEATLSSADNCTVQCLATLADAVAQNTRTVRHVIGDATWFPDQRWSPGMSWNNIPFRYGTGIAALSLDDNEFELEVSPTRIGAPPEVGAGYYTVDNRAVTVAGEENALRLMRMPGSNRFVMTGALGVNAEAPTYRFGIDDPAHYAAWRFARMLEARGLAVTGAIEGRYRPLGPMDDPERRAGTHRPAPDDKPLLAQLPPEDIAANIVTINKVSQNLHSELMLRRVGRISGTGSIADGQAAVKQMAAQAGVVEQGFVLSDGSGMSSYNRLTPRGTAMVLRWVARHPWGESWRQSLPIGGIDGTLSRRFGGTPLKGRIFAKTGSLNASRALSGYLIAASGEMLIFSAFANDISPDGDDAATAAMDAALVAVAAAN